MSDTRTPIAVVGPTAVGKSTLAEQLAVHIGGEIVSADSMQVYRGMDVGTAKTPPAERQVPYHCVDLVDPGRGYSAALFQHNARAAIDDILARGLTPVVVGGTGLYLRAALDEFDFPPGELCTDLRAELEERARAGGAGALHAELAELDPSAAERIHPNNVRRTIRALEMLTLGRPYSAQASGFGTRTDHYPGTRYLGLTMGRDALYERINDRVDAMVDAGLPAEVERLLDDGYGEALTAMQAIGYKELIPVLTAGASLADAVEQIKRSSRRYAKRQLSWFRADPRIMWLDVTAMPEAEITAHALDLLESSARPQ